MEYNPYIIEQEVFYYAVRNNKDWEYCAVTNENDYVSLELESDDVDSEYYDDGYLFFESEARHIESWAEENNIEYFHKKITQTVIVDF